LAFHIDPPPHISLLDLAHGLSSTHAFFFSMGGFVSRAGHHPITTIAQLETSPLGTDYLSAMRRTDVDDILDKSKGDALSKSIALLQGLWFIIQCITRATQHLPMSQLEISTLAFAVVNVFTWLLWWNKPLDVHRPISIGPMHEHYSPYHYGPPLQSEPSMVRRQAFKSLLVGPISGDYDEYDPTGTTSVPTFWSSSDPNPYAMWIEVCVGVVFGAIHCAAWNVSFPSDLERLLWRCGSVIITILPALIGFTILTDKFVDHVFSHDVRFAEALLRGPFVAIGLPVLPVYIFFRLLILTLSLSTLRALPRGAFVDIDWTVVIPHI
jgi:hypothetical protein